MLKHYFQPGNEAFPQPLSAAMPALLTNGSQRTDGGQDSKKEMLEIIGRLKGSKKDKARLLELVGKL